MSMNDNETVSIEEAKRRARAELDAYRERMARERAAKAAAAITAEEEIASAIQRRRAEEAEQAEVRAERNRVYAEREARLEADRQAERAKRLAGDPRIQVAETPARRLARLLRRRLGDDFEAFLADLGATDWRLFRIEVARIPADERAEALHREHQERAVRLAAEAATLPEPECEEEREILQRHGFVTR